MKRDDQAMLDRIDARGPQMRSILRNWAETNSGTTNVAGVTAMARLASEALEPLAQNVRLIDLPPRTVVSDEGELVEQPVGPLVEATARPGAPLRVLLSGHLDTVFPADSPFQHVRAVDETTWNGPGVADLKGGLVVLLAALEAFEQHPDAAKLGWTVLLNPDEEVGSPASAPLLAEAAGRHHVGLVFEPALADGRLAGSRGGGANYDITIRGRSAHVGREFARGRSAMHAAAEAIVELIELNERKAGVTINIGRIDGGGPVNRVAEVAVVRLNARAADAAAQAAVEEALAETTARLNERDGIAASLHGRFFSPPKPIDGCGGRTLQLFEFVRETGRELGLQIDWTDTGGVCDGNKLQAAGLPTVDTLGVRGGHLHSDQEFVILDSLPERAKLAALLLARLARGEGAEIANPRS